MATPKMIKFRVENEQVGKFVWTPPLFVQKLLRRLTVEQLDDLKAGVESAIESSLAALLTAVVAKPLATAALEDLKQSLDHPMVKTAMYTTLTGLSAILRQPKKPDQPSPSVDS